MKHVAARVGGDGQEYVCTNYDAEPMHQGRWQDTGYYEEMITGFASWQGCVEARPYPTM